MSAVWSTLLQGRATLGAESTRFDLQRSISGVETKHDVIHVLTATGAGEATVPGPIVTVWESPDHGETDPGQQFRHLYVIPDPDEGVQGVFVGSEEVRCELAFTDAAGAVTFRTFTIDRDRPLCLAGSGVEGELSENDIAAHITRVRLRLSGNPSSDLEVPVRTLVLG